MMSLVRLLGFTTLGCGCVTGQYREVATNREVTYVEEKGSHCEHSRASPQPHARAAARRVRQPRRTRVIEPPDIVAPLTGRHSRSTRLAAHNSVRRG